MDLSIQTSALLNCVLPGLSFCYKVNHSSGLSAYLCPENLKANLLPIPLTCASNVISRVCWRQSQFLPVVLSPSKHSDLDNKLSGHPGQKHPPPPTHWLSILSTVPLNNHPCRHPTSSCQQLSNFHSFDYKNSAATIFHTHYILRRSDF